MNTTWHSEKPPRCYGAICAALVVMSMGQVARRVCKGSAWAYTLRVTLPVGIMISSLSRPGVT